MASLMLKVSIPDIDVNKILKVGNGELVWSIKMQLVKKMTVLENGMNYAFFVQNLPNKQAGYLDDSQILFAYQLPNNTELILRKKQRILNELSEKQKEKWNNKKMQKSFCEWVSKKAYQKVKDALQKGLDPNFLNESGESPLSLAVSQDDSQMIVLLIQNGAAFPDYRNADWKTPIHKAAILGHDRACQTLLSLGASPDPKDKDGHTPLYLACMNAQGEIAKSLLKSGSSFDTIDEKGRTELHFAALKNSPIAVSALVSYGADLNRRNETGNTALHLCSSANATECAKALLEGGCDYEIGNQAGDTAFQVAVMATNWDVADIIGNFKPEQRKPKVLKEGKRSDGNLGGLPFLKVPEYIPPPPPVGYKGICAPPFDAPIR